MSKKRPESGEVFATLPHRPTGDVAAFLRLDFGTAGIPRRLPRGSGSLPAHVVEAAQRARLMNAVAHVVADKGYAAGTTHV